MRVISGSAKGALLRSPSEETRPTKDRVREAVFNILHHAIEWEGLRVLDLFCGSGALGIEALSRGATSATFVDENKFATKCVETNLRQTRLEGTVRSADVFRFLSQQAKLPHRFDLILADPPYCKDAEERNFGRELVESADLPVICADAGFFVLETSRDTELPENPRWEILDQRHYGSTMIHFFRLK
ncbi:MAG: 16S rRNA (guanine(966)-N(2))-methyltransferase RsmD [Verrucomicrobiota bacterium]